jgi:hypothetical protein
MSPPVERCVGCARPYSRTGGRIGFFLVGAAGTAGAAASILYATMLFAVGVATVRYAALPRWTGILALIAAPLQFLYIPSIFGVEHIFDVTDGILGVYATFGTFLSWCIAAGIAIARHEPARVAASEPLARGLSPVGAA